MGRKTKIDWCDSTWNPVTGCLHGCEYCYARKIARRFGGGFEVIESYDDGMYNPVCEPFEASGDNHELDYAVGGQPYPFFFDPTFHRCRLDEPQCWKKPKTIFVCSMADLFGEWVPDEWIQEVFKACEAAPQHRYLFLTKNPKRYIDLAIKGMMPEYTGNMWFGTSTPTPETDFWHSKQHNTFVSVEPILKPFVDLGGDCTVVNWIIVGAETGNRKDKVVPQKDWIMEISEACKRDMVPLFMKESLREIMGDDFRQEFPWEVKE